MWAEVGSEAKSRQQGSLGALQALLTPADTALMIFDRDLTLVFANSAYEAVFELPRYEVLGLSVEAVFARHKDPLTHSPFKINPDVHKSGVYFDLDLLLHNGKRKKLGCNRYTIVDNLGIFQGMVITIGETCAHDDMINAGPQFNNYHIDFFNMINNLRKFMEESDRGFAVYDRELMFVYCNKKFESITRFPKKRMIGLKPCEVSGMIFNDFDSNPDYERIMCSDDSKWNFEGPVVLHDGNQLQIRLDVFPLTCVRGETYGLVKIITDVEREKKEEERNKLLSKFTLVGEMAATLAHEVRNPMTSIRGLAQLLKESSNPELEHLYDLMIEEIDRANSLLANFLNLARNNVPRRESVDMVKVLNSSLALIKGDLINKNIILHTDIDSNCSCVGDPYQLRQAFLNLLRNACEAMSQGGRLKVTGAHKEDKVVIEISDTGLGISQTVQEQVLEPFFTTKDGGTGLGLSVSYRIFQEHDGRMMIESREGKGTRIMIELPIESRDSLSEIR